VELVVTHQISWLIKTKENITCITSSIFLQVFFFFFFFGWYLKAQVHVVYDKIKLVGVLQAKIAAHAHVHMGTSSNLSLYNLACTVRIMLLIVTWGVQGM